MSEPRRWRIYPCHDDRFHDPSSYHYCSARQKHESVEAVEAAAYDALAAKLKEAEKFQDDAAERLGERIVEVATLERKLKEAVGLLKRGEERGMSLEDSIEWGKQIDAFLKENE